MSSLLRLEQQQKRFLKIHFELAYFSFFLSFSVEIETTTTFVHSRSSFENQLDSRPKWAKSIPIFNQNDGHKIPTLWGGTYLYGLYMGLPPPPPPGVLSTSWVWLYEDKDSMSVNNRHYVHRKQWKWTSPCLMTTLHQPCLGPCL